MKVWQPMQVSVVGRVAELVRGGGKGSGRGSSRSGDSSRD